MAERFPLPEEKLALIDLDETLLDRTYKVTNPAIYDTISSVQESGWLVGMSSDTPYEAMRTWHQRFGMNGPIIAEKGAVVDHSGQPLYDTQDSHCYDEAYQRIRNYLLDQGVMVWEGDPVEAFREELQIGQPGDTVVLLNDQRKASLGLFIRAVEETGTLTIDEDLTNSITEAARDLYPGFNDLSEDLNHDYGLVIVTRAEVTKRQGTIRLQQAKGIGQIAMIGNSETDYVGEDIALHFAVGNATPSFKELADYTASSELSGGVVEILRALSLAAADREHAEKVG